MYGSGTISGDIASENAGSMMELSWGGKNPLNLDGITRTFLEDGDTIIISGGRTLENGQFVGFGEVETTVIPATN